MKETVSSGQAVIGSEAVLPARVQEASGELIGAAREGRRALSLGVGLGVSAELMEEEVVEVVGPGVWGAITRCAPHETVSVQFVCAVGQTSEGMGSPRALAVRTSVR